MATAATGTTSLFAFTLPGTPRSVQLARFYVRTALDYHDLGGYAEDAEIVTSELASNAIRHAAAPTFGLQVMRLAGTGAVAVIVTDPSPRPPIRRDPTGDAEHGRGLNIVDALSATWGWRPQDPGKAVYAVLARNGAS